MLLVLLPNVIVSHFFQCSWCKKARGFCLSGLMFARKTIFYTQTLDQPEIKYLEPTATKESQLNGKNQYR